MLVENVDRIIGDDVSALLRQLGDETQMPAENRRAEIEPLLNVAPLFRSNDRRRAKTQTNAAHRETLLQRLHSRERRRRMTEEWIEDDLRRTRLGGRIRILDAIHLRAQTERFANVLSTVVRADVRNRRIDVAAALGFHRLLCPVATQHELFYGFLTQMILLAHRQEEIRRQ